MATSQEILEPIDFSEDITTEIIRRCELLLAENDEYKKLKDSGRDFNSIKIYGSRQEPCFKAKDIYLYVDPTGGNKKWFNKQLVPEKHIFKANIRNIKSNENKTWTKVEPTNMLTRKGLMKAFSICNGVIADTFQDYVFDLLDGLWKNEKDVMKKQMKITEKNLEEERNKRREAEIINLQNIHLQEAYCNDFESNDSNGIELTILRRLHLTKYYLYIVDWNYVNSAYWKKDKEPKELKEPKPSKSIKKIDTQGIDLDSSDDDSTPSARETNRQNCENFAKGIAAAPRVYTKRTAIPDEPHRDGINDPYEFEYVTLGDLENSSNDEFYLHITNKEIDPKKDHFKFITHIYLDKKKHFDDMVKYITQGETVIDRTAYPVNGHEPKEIKTAEFFESTPIKKIYKTTYEMVCSARNRTYVNMHRDALK
jgi:hypothetical protein